MRIAQVFGAGLAVILMARVAGAQNDPAGAEALFRAGKELLRSGGVVEACRKLEESQKLDPAGGTLFALGECYERQGRTATAWARYTEALQSTGVRGNEGREARVRDRIAALEKSLARISIAVPGEVAALPGLVVLRDDVPIGGAAWDVAMPVDPGFHTVDATATGRGHWTISVEARAGATRSVTVVAPAEVAPPAEAVAAPLPVVIEPPPPTHGADASAAPSPAAPHPANNVAARAASYVLLATGAAAAGLGAFFVVRHGTLNRDAQQLCPGGGACDAAHFQAARTDRSDAVTTGELGVTGLVAGGVFLLGGAVLFVSSGSSGQVSIAPGWTRDGGSVAVHGAF